MLGLWRRKFGAASFSFCRLRWLFAATGALALAACTTDAETTAMNLVPRGATVAFESIDGPPQDQFYKLVQDLNDEAQSRRLSVMSRERPAAYRVRGYLAADTENGKTSITWVWDVFDADGSRALRISGAEAAPGKHRDAWAAADDAVLHRIAGASMDQLAAFLTSPDVAPVEAPSTLASLGLSSPEAAGIFRIFHAEADPVPGVAVPIPATNNPIDPVPLPRRRPTVSAAHSAHETVAAAALDR
jgi:hypothetical protein